jgi:hypothetical protein
MKLDIPPSGLGLHVVQRFYLLPIVLLAVPVAVGIDRVLGARFAAARYAFVGLVALPLLAAPALARVQAEHTAALEHSILNTLRALPPGAALITKSDDLYFGSVYVQAVLGVRPDVLVVASPMLRYPWYRARIAARGATPGPGDAPPNVRLASALLAAGHAVYVDSSEPEILAAFPAYPYAGVLHVLPRGAPLPKLDAVVAENQAAFAAFDLGEPTPGPDDGYPTVVHLRYADTWRRIAAAYAAQGFPAAAKAARDTADVVGVPGVVGVPAM